VIRRIFLKCASAAAVAFVVGMEHFRPIKAEIDIDIEGREIDVDTQHKKLSSVLQALDKWNEGRVETLRVMGVAGAELYWEPQEPIRLTTNNITARAVPRYEIAQREFNEKAR